MDYEKKKYKERYERLINSDRFKNIYNDKSLGDCPIEIPELKESEDEKIRKTLIDLIKCNERSGYSSFNNVNTSSMLAWLEKQGEQNPVDKVEPKFKVGDWVVKKSREIFCNCSKFAQITKIDKDKERCWFDCGTWLGAEYIKPWTIQDAKDGDVLEFKDHERVVVGIVSFVNKRTGKVDVSCLLEDNKFKIGNFYALDTINPHPATKEQRDLLLQKMKEAGYEWDAKKKELKKIGRLTDWLKELKSLKSRVQPKQEWSEEEEKLWVHDDDIFLDAAKTIVKDSPRRSYGGVHKNQIVPWFYSLKERLKSIRHQNTWKPSDEQIKALGIAIRIGIQLGTWEEEALESLKEQLKKLKEE